MNRKVERFESHFKSFDQSEIFFQGWLVKNPVGAVIVCHGICEHSDAHALFANRLNEKSWNVYALDLRGHGRSDGKRGYVNSFTDFEKDLHELNQLVYEKYHDHSLPLILFGHSMGGLISLKNIVSFGPQNFVALALSAPELGITLHVPAWKEKASEFLAQYAPKLTLGANIKFEDLTRDPELLASYPKDPLRHDKVSARLYLGMTNGFTQFPQFAPDIKLPVLIQVSDHDPIVDTEAIKVVFELLGSSDKTLKIYKNRKHEIFNDIDSEEIFNEFFQFLDKFAASGEIKKNSNNKKMPQQET